MQLHAENSNLFYLSKTTSFLTMLLFLFLICKCIRNTILKFLDGKDNETEKNVVFGNCNAFQRKLIYQVIQRDFPDEITATSQTVNNQKAIVIERKWSAERQQQEVQQQNQDDESEYRRLVGLSALLLKISQSVSDWMGYLIELVVGIHCSFFFGRKNRLLVTTC